MTTIIVLAALFSNALAQASPTPCMFWSGLPAANSGPDYNIGGAYTASDLVAIGKADGFVREKPQKIRITAVIKGRPTRQILLEGIHLNGTDSWGAAISTDGEYLMLLKGGARYTWVDQGSACPNVFKVSGKKVKIGAAEIGIKDLKSYFESGPKPLSTN